MGSIMGTLDRIGVAKGGGEGEAEGGGGEGEEGVGEGIHG